MKPLTNYLHKAMIPFSGIPFLAYSLHSIPEESHVVIIVNYLAAQIVNYFGNCYNGRHLEYLIQRNPQGTGDALVQFSETYHPKHPVIVWQADQMIFPNEVTILSQSEPNAAVCSRSRKGFQDLGFWKIKPSTLGRLNGYFDGTEYRALPVLEKENLKQIAVQRDKLEISLNTWEDIELQCKHLKQRFSAEFH